ncbi:MAG TPA: hypothetical protein VJI97_04475 [Candidatus Nanoarchaeia archaeon]|nr:hypothetical protein [Candidatus Nanoarchaeia archaeon]
MEHDYRNIISHIDVDRSLNSIEYSSFAEFENIEEFRSDMEEGNDSIELHLIKSKAYKEALVMKLKQSLNSEEWRNLLKEEQKTFGGSKIFYINNNCTKLLVLSLPNEINNKLNMIVTRLNKINEKITRVNGKIKKDNFDLYNSRVKVKDSNKKKEDIINFINQNLRV